MTLEEAIRHCEEKSRFCHTECEKDHRQLAEWLKELYELKKQKSNPPITSNGDKNTKYYYISYSFVDYTNHAFFGYVFIGVPVLNFNNLSNMIYEHELKDKNVYKESVIILNFIEIDENTFNENKYN